MEEEEGRHYTCSGKICLLGEGKDICLEQMIIRSLPYASTPYFFEANSFATWLKNNPNDKNTRINRRRTDERVWNEGKRYSLRRKNEFIAKT